MKHVVNFLTGLFIALACSVFLLGCISSKKLHKHNVSKDTSFVDKTEIATVITEKVDTVVYTKADTTKFSIPTTDTTTVIMDTPTARIEARYNKKTKHVDVTAIEKAKPVIVHVNKKTETKQKNNIIAKGKEVDKGKDLDKKTFSLPWWLWLIIAILLALVAIWKFYIKPVYFPLKR